MPQKDPPLTTEATILDHWNFTGVVSIAAFNHAVDVANANYRRAEAAESALQAQATTIQQVIAEMRQAADYARRFANGNLAATYSEQWATRLSALSGSIVTPKADEKA
jgi:hypothetical protein